MQLSRVKRRFIFPLSVWVLLSCSGGDKETMLESALRLAGSNRSELEKVLKHYGEKAGDSLKLRSAIFLIENMPHHYTVESDVFDYYYRQADSLFSLSYGPTGTRDRLDSLYKKFSSVLGHAFHEGVMRKDIEHMTAGYLIRNIDHAYYKWREGPWTKHVTFEDFCEYILPYRFGTENIEDWRERLEEKFSERIDWLNDYDQKRHSAYWSTLHLNHELDKRGAYTPSLPIDHPVSYYESMKIGDCKDYAVYALFVMRACGIPVCVDYTPQWPNRGKRHIWNVVLNNNGKDVVFLGGDIDPGYPHYPADKFAKIFRRTYAFQKNSLFAMKGDEKIPPNLDTPFIKVVSEKYFEGTDVDVEIPRNVKTSNRFAYLAVFDNRGWVPVQWGEISRGGNVKFEKMGRSIVYLPVLYENKSVEGISLPILVNDTGKVIPLVPDTMNRQRLVLKRKFPKFTGVLDYSKRVVGARIVASNYEHFKDSTIAGIIRRNPLMKYDTLNINTNEKYRYWKYLSPDSSFCDIAELKFFQDKADISGEARVTTNGKHFGRRTVECAFDGDELTYHQSVSPSGGWIMLDFGKPVRIDHIKYLPRNDDNNVKPGDTYELLYWGDNHWRSMGAFVSDADSLVYDNAPTNALFLLRNHTRGSEERIFTYEDGKQAWW